MTLRPVTGGLLSSIGWQWIFLINLPVGVVVLLLAAHRLPVTVQSAPHDLDVLGAVSGTGGLTLLILGVIQGGSHGWDSTSTLGVLAGAVLVLAVFVARQHTATAPLIPTQLLHRREVTYGNAVMAVVGTLMFGTFFVITLYLQHVRGLAPHQAGLLYLPIPVALITGTQIAPVSPHEWASSTG